MTRLCTCPRSVTSSLELKRKRNHRAQGSCKTCGGIFLVDGIGSISESMLGTVGLEVTNSVNAELNWKTVKGKRSRKPVGRSLDGRQKLASKSPKRVGDFSGSDSDKLGETGSGQPFTDRVEYVPLKKRRHLLRSPSPPRRPFLDGPECLLPLGLTLSTQSEDLEQLSDHNASSGQRSSGSYSNRREVVAGVGSSVDDGVPCDKFSGVAGVELYSSEDFSGIALLAAAACINNIDDDIDNAKGDVMEVSSVLQESNTSASSVLFRESISSSVSHNQMGKDLPLPDDKKCSHVADYPVPTGRSSDENEECVATRSVSSKVDRRHWDLNTVMEAWEEPPDDVALENNSAVQGAVNGMQVDKLDSDGFAAQSNYDNTCEIHVPLEPIDEALESSLSKTQENKPEEFPCLDGPNAASNQDVRPKCPSKVVCEGESLGDFPLVESCHAHSISNSGENTNLTSCYPTMIQCEDGKCVTESTDGESIEQKFTPTEFQGLEKSGRENDVSVENTTDSWRTSELPENRGEVSTGIVNALDVENSEAISGDSQRLLPKCEDLSISDTAVGSQSAVSGDGIGEEKKASNTDAKRTEVAVHADSKEVLSKCDDPLVSNTVEEKISNVQDSGKGSVYDDSHKSDVSQDDRCHLDGAENVDDQVDYDSPYEDGELRGSVLCCWDGDEVEDGEHECVDYEADSRGGDHSDAGDSPGSEIVEAVSEGSQGTEKKNLLAQIPECESRKNTGSARSFSRKEVSNLNKKIVSGGKRGPNQGSRTTEGIFTDMVVERGDGSLRRRRSFDRVDAFDVKGSYAGEVGLKATKGKLQSRIEGPSSLDISERNNQQGRARNVVGSLSRSERDGSADRFVPRYRSAVHEHDRNGDGRLIYWDSRNRFPSGYRGLENHGHTRSRSGIVGSVDKFGGLNFHDHKQPINYSKGMQRQLVRRRSPIDRVDFYGVHNRRIAGISSHRSRGGSGSFSGGIGRGLRDEYSEPVIDDAVVSSARMPHYLSRRDRSFSPPLNRVTHVSAPRRKSRSRSRTPSPRAWEPQRERNLGTRRHSRSPEFRPESRMDRMRVPFQKPSFTDYGENFMSPPRGRFSPPRNYNRWVDNRNFVDDHLGHRRSPVGAFRRSQKLDHHGGCSGRLKSDDHLRAMGRPGRYPLMDGVGRGCKLEENSDDRRNDERSRVTQRVRHSETGAILRRSRHGAEDNFDAGNLNNADDIRSTDRRDVPRSAREEKRTFKV